MIEIGPVLAFWLGFSIMVCGVGIVAHWLIWRAADGAGSRAEELVRESKRFQRGEQR